MEDSAYRVEDAFDADIDSSNNADEPAEDSTKQENRPSGTIDSVYGRRSLPFSVTALVISFVILYLTPILDFVLGFGNPLATIDSGMKLLLAVFFAFGIGIFWEYIF
ncbi:MAG: hypothetical protein WC408_02240 [Candidatus Micrarchaeia archaeon]|jgi:hypothetical protein